MLSGSDLSRLAEFEALKCKQVSILSQLEVLTAQIRYGVENPDDTIKLHQDQRIEDFNRAREALDHLIGEFRNL